VSNENERNKNNEEELGGVEWKLNEIRDELLDDIEELRDDFGEEIELILEESEEIKDELREELEELEDEKESLLKEIEDLREGLEDLGVNAKERIEKTKEKLGNLKEKTDRYEKKLRERIKKKLENARKKVDKRINISVDPAISEEWKDWAEGLGASVSELVRKSMKFVKNNIGDITKLEQFGHEMGKMGVKIEKAVKNSGIEKLGDKLDEKIEKQIKKGKSKVHIATVPEIDKERMKKRVDGLIKLYKNLPIDKLAQAMEISLEEAENLIYELASEGIDGDLQENVFKFTSTSEEVLEEITSKLFEMIDKM